ncbi:MAG: hypothetical protein ACE5JL_07700 [Dehalococcoidia bacterium]
MREISIQHIQASVDQALESASNREPSPRLLPFTPAQMAFLRELVTQALANALASPER